MSTAARTNVVRFSLTGEAITQAARQCLLEDEPARAYRILSTGLIGSGAHEAALAILKGEKDLVGDSDLALVRSKKTKALKKWLSDVRYIYAGRFKRWGQWVRPVAWMIDVKWHRWEPGEREQGKILDMPGHGRVWVRFDPCNERPHWEIPPTTAQAALDETFAVGRELARLQPYSEVEGKGKRSRTYLNDDGIWDVDQDEQVEPSFTIVSHGYVEPTEEEVEEDERRNREFKAEVQRIRDAIREQAGDDTFEMPLSDGRVLVVPRAPFVHWALGRTEFIKTAPPWNIVSRSGFKMQNDDPAHTDWWIGAGLDPDDYKPFHTGPIERASYDKKFELQEAARDAARPKQKFAGIFAALDSVRTTRHKATVIIDNGERTGTVGVDIAVLPDSTESRSAEIEGCKGVVVERGGPLAHITILSKGLGLTMMHHANACELFKPGMIVTLNPASGRITIVAEGPSA